MSGTIYGVGLGPGDPELMSVKAHRLITSARHVAFFRKRGRNGHARGIAEAYLPDGAILHAMEYPVTTELPFDGSCYKTLLARFYEDWTARLRALSEAGEEVVVLCEGDPFFYGSFMHLHSRLSPHVPVEVVPAITGMSGAWTATGRPITWGDDVLTVLMGTLPEAELARRMADTDALVVMKIGRHMPKIRRALAAAGRLGGAWLVEHATMTGERRMRLVDAPDGPAPYFSLVIVHGEGRRP